MAHKFYLLKKGRKDFWIHNDKKLLEYFQDRGFKIIKTKEQMVL